MAKFGPKYAFLVILGQILPFLHILSNARPKNNVNKVPRWVFRYVGNKAYDFSSKKKDFLPQNDQIWPEIGIFGHFVILSFGALLAGLLVVGARAALAALGRLAAFGCLRSRSCPQRLVPLAALAVLG